MRLLVTYNNNSVSRNTDAHLAISHKKKSAHPDKRRVAFRGRSRAGRGGWQHGRVLRGITDRQRQAALSAFLAPACVWWGSGSWTSPSLCLRSVGQRGCGGRDALQCIDTRRLRLREDWRVGQGGKGSDGTRPMTSVLSRWIRGCRPDGCDEPTASHLAGGKVVPVPGRAIWPPACSAAAARTIICNRQEGSDGASQAAEGCRCMLGGGQRARGVMDTKKKPRYVGTA